MDEEKRLLYGLISRLLDYPDADFPTVEVVGPVVEKMPEWWRQKLLGFLSYAEKTPLLKFQEEYTRTFDLNPDLCLNITFHKWGGDKNRGRALAELKKMYLDAGFEISGGELPDYLPIILEFLSACPDVSCFLLHRYGDQLRLIASRLRDTGSPYAGLIEILDPEWKRSPL